MFKLYSLLNKPNRQVIQCYADLFIHLHFNLFTECCEEKVCSYLSFKIIVCVIPFRFKRNCEARDDHEIVPDQIET